MNEENTIAAMAWELSNMQLNTALVLLNIFMLYQAFDLGLRLLDEGDREMKNDLVVEWLEGEKHFFKKEIQNIISDAQKRLIAAEKLADALKSIAHRPIGGDTETYFACVNIQNSAKEALNEWEKATK